MSWFRLCRNDPAAALPCRAAARSALLCAVLAIGTFLAPPSATRAQEFAPPPAGTYHLDPAHARLIFQVSHLGFSNYTALFRTFDATLAFDPAAPEAMVLTASVDPASVETFYPDTSFDFNAVIAGKEFLDAQAFPAMTFTSTGVELTGDNMADVTGDLTLHGVTKPLILHVTYNGGYGGNPMDPQGRIGFSAHGALNRSDYGMGFGVPAPGSSMGVFDEVTILIEAEFLNPDAPQPPAP